MLCPEICEWQSRNIIPLRYVDGEGCSVMSLRYVDGEGCNVMSLRYVDGNLAVLCP